MRLVKEKLLEFHKNEDPIKSLDIGAYKAWRDFYNGKTIIDITFKLSHEEIGKNIYKVYLNYLKSHPEFGDEAFFLTDNGNPPNFFRGNENAEDSILIPKEIVNEKIIKPLIERGDDAVIEVLDFYGEDIAAELGLSFLQYLRDYINNFYGFTNVIGISAKYNRG